MTEFSVDKAFLIAGWLGAVLWSAYTILFGCWVYIIFHKPKFSVGWPLIGVTIVLYTLSTLDTALTLTRLINAFITYRAKIDPIIYLITAPAGPKVGHVLDFIYSINLILGDTLVVWRCWIVWSRNVYVIALPVLLLLGTVAVALGSPITTVVPNPSETVGIRFGTSMFVLSFITNVFVTSLTAVKIWWIARRQKVTGNRMHRRYRALLLIILESGLLIAAAKTVELVLFEISPSDGLDGDNALYIIFDIMPHLMGIVPTLIFVTLGLGLTSGEPDHGPWSITTQENGLHETTNGESHGNNTEDLRMSKMSMDAQAAR